MLNLQNDLTLFKNGAFGSLCYRYKVANPRFSKKSLSRFERCCESTGPNALRDNNSSTINGTFDYCCQRLRLQDHRLNERSMHHVAKGAFKVW